MSSDKDKFSDFLLSTKLEGNTKEYLSKIKYYTDKEIKEENIFNVISVLFDIGDFLETPKDNTFSSDIDAYIFEIIIELLSRCTSENDKYNIILQSIQHCQKSIGTAVQFLRRLRYKNLNIFPNDQLQTFENLALDKIYKWQKNDINFIENSALAYNTSLINNVYLSSILFFWLEHGNKKDLNNYIKYLSQSEENLFKILKSIAKQTIDMSNYITYLLDNSTLTVFFNCSELYKKIEIMKYNIDKYSMEEQQIINSTIMALNNEPQDIF